MTELAAGVFTQAGQDDTVIPLKVDHKGRLEDETSPAEEFVPVTKADANLAGGLTRALLVGTAGTANLMQANGTIRTNVPLQQGYNPLQCLQVRTGGTAADIWALY